MNFAPLFDWAIPLLILLLSLAFLYFHVLFILQSRKSIMAEPLGNQFWHPNLGWLCLVPAINIVWVPLTVFAIEKTISKGKRNFAYSEDLILLTCGRFLKYWYVVLLGLQFYKYLIVFYAPRFLSAVEAQSTFPIKEQSTGVVNPVIWALLTTLDIAFYLVFLGMIVSIIWYPVRLGKLLTEHPVRRGANTGRN